jgi:FkbM family methyltransferase
MTISSSADSTEPDALHSLLRPSRLTSVVDIGASGLVGGDPPYKTMLLKEICQVIGFEPQDDALAKLIASKSGLETYFPFAIGDGGEARLKLCRHTGFTSLLTPDPAALRYFLHFSGWGEVIAEHQVQTRRLDDVVEIENLDFLKIDIQGAELSVFTSGRQKLKTAVVIQTEIAFTKLYKDQPSFGEVDTELRKQGFVPHAFTDISRRMILPMVDQGQPFAALNQLVEADMVYVRDFTRPEKMDAEQLKHLALIAHHCYRSFDLAANCIQNLVARDLLDAGAMNRYLALIS